jgi:hypothetical protein
MNSFPFQRSCKFHKLPFNLRKNLTMKCKGEQIDLKTQLKLPTIYFICIKLIIFYKEKTVYRQNVV